MVDVAARRVDEDGLPIQSQELPILAGRDASVNDPRAPGPLVKELSSDHLCDALAQSGVNVVLLGLDDGH